MGGREAVPDALQDCRIAAAGTGSRAWTVDPVMSRSAENGTDVIGVAAAKSWLGGDGMAETLSWTAQVSKAMPWR
jgi:hypothetical protein